MLAPTISTISRFPRLHDPSVVRRPCAGLAVAHRIALSRDLPSLSHVADYPCPFRGANTVNGAPLCSFPSLSLPSSCNVKAARADYLIILDSRRSGSTLLSLRRALEYRHPTNGGGGGRHETREPRAARGGGGWRRDRRGGWRRMGKKKKRVRYISPFLLTSFLPSFLPIGVQIVFFPILFPVGNVPSKRGGVGRGR